MRDYFSHEDNPEVEMTITEDTTSEVENPKKRKASIVVIACLCLGVIFGLTQSLNQPIHDIQPKQDDQSAYDAGFEQGYMDGFEEESLGDVKTSIAIPLRVKSAEKLQYGVLIDGAGPDGYSISFYVDYLLSVAGYDASELIGSDVVVYLNEYGQVHDINPFEEDPLPPHPYDTTVNYFELTHTSANGGS